MDPDGELCEQVDMSELDVLGVLSGTDKSSSHSSSWDYLRHYERLFERFRASEINLLEIGVDSGASIEVWLSYFEKARIVGIDLNPDCARFARDRAVVRIGSQDDPAFLQSVAAEWKPSIVIDDGSHLAHHMITAFETLFPALLPGGVYVFEDLSFHFADGVGQSRGHEVHRGLADRSIFDYLLPFMRARAANLSRPDASWGFERYAFEQIDSVEVFGGGIALWKRQHRDLEADLALFERELPRARDQVGAAERYAAFLLKHNARPDRTASLLSDVVAKRPQSQWARYHLPDVLVRLGRLEEATAAAEELARLFPDSAPSWAMVAEVSRHTGRKADELSALERLASLEGPSPETLARISSLQESLDEPSAVSRQVAGQAA